jgi:4-hydroxybenzoate polyprenyltransferase
MSRVYAYLQLMRPANLVTALSDVWAGAAIAGFFTMLSADNAVLTPLWWISFATVCLYGGGVVFNDVCDRQLDRLERPERPLPSGRAGIAGAVALGSLLLIVGIGTAWKTGLPGGMIALAIACLSLIYDKWGKHHEIGGPLNMGLCRGLNLCLGMSLLPAALPAYAALSLVPVIYIAAVTMISRGEVHGGSRRILYGAAVLYGLVIVAVLAFAGIERHLVMALPFLAIFGAMIFPPLWKAVQDPAGPEIGRAVKAGVLALILMNAAWIAGAGHVGWAVLTAVLLPVSLLLAKLFAVT